MLSWHPYRACRRPIWSALAQTRLSIRAGRHVGGSARAVNALFYRCQVLRRQAGAPLVDAVLAIPRSCACPLTTVGTARETEAKLLLREGS